MKLRLLLAVVLILLFPSPARSHVGSPDVYYEGMVGPWPTHVTIRVPGVVPGRASIIVQVQSKEPVAVTFMPLSSKTAVSNAPPAELALPARGETNLYAGELWLMTSDAYCIQIRVRGRSGEGSVQIPVDSVATAQLPLPTGLAQILLVLGLILFCSGLAIVAAAAGESALPPGVAPGKSERRKYWIAATVTGAVLALALAGGKKWWDAEETDFRSRLREGGWPDLAAEVRIEGSQRILSLTLGKTALAADGPQARLDLAPDHGKLLHLFLVGLPSHQFFGHLHPVRKGNTTFEVALPPLPEGDYEVFCDLTQSSGLSSTATNSVHLPPVPDSAAVPVAAPAVQPDADDSWTTNSTVAVREKSGGDTLCRLPGGTEIIWKGHSPLHSRQNAALQFEVRDQAGQPASLQPYMGMMSHAAVLRSDGHVFAHLHPSGNYSMAAQIFFENKMANEIGAGGNADAKRPLSLDHSKVDEWCGPPPVGGGAPFISLPYEFPAPGNYRIWVQIKTEGQVQTAIFDTTVAPLQRNPQIAGN